MKKKVLSLIVVSLLAISMLGGCAPKKEEASGTADQKYGLFMSHMSNAFTTELSGAVQAKAEELGVEVTVFDGEKDPAKQISQVESAITQGYTGIIIEAASVDGIKPAVEAAKNAGIPVVTVNQKIAQQELANCFVGVSHEEGGALEMQAAVDAIGGNGNVAFLLGPMGSDAQIGRCAGYEEVMAKHPDIKMVFEQSANWNTDEALKLVENWLQTGTQIDIIVANNDGMALGALKAVEDAQMQDKIKVYGLDAVADALAAVKEGRLAATVSQSTSEQGSNSMQACYDIVNGKDVPAEIIVGHTLITKDNVDEFIK